MDPDPTEVAREREALRALGHEEATALMRKLEHVLEPGIRQHLVVERVAGLGSTRACALIGAALRSPHDGGRDWSALRALLHDLLLKRPDTPPCLSYIQRRELYEAAFEQDDEEVMRLLRSASEWGEEAGRRLPPDLADVPLGRRRSLAKSEEGHWLELLALDPDPVVTRNLLRNPRTCEADVVRIAALRPVGAATLHEIAASPRWANNVKVRTAVARNPHCPPDLAGRVLVTLPLVVLREMRADPDLHPEIKAELRRELARRS